VSQPKNHRKRISEYQILGTAYSETGRSPRRFTLAAFRKGFLSTRKLHCLTYPTCECGI
jgi:hypothetical protein